MPNSTNPGTSSDANSAAAAQAAQQRTEALRAEIDEERAKTLVLQVLARHGWTLTSGTAVATKTFETAVGPRTALAYLYFNRRPDEPNWSLHGDYVSEGRNCLECEGVLLPKSAPAPELEELVTKFCQQADTAVLATYAARLLRS